MQRVFVTSSSVAAALAVLLTLAGCGSKKPKQDARTDEPAVTETDQQPDTPSSDTKPAAPETTDATPPEPNPLRDAYFGDLHLHTSYSFDAFLEGTTATPDDAYEFAKNVSDDWEGMTPPGGGDPIKRKFPLDFAAVTDHSEYLGVLQKAFGGRRIGDVIPKIATREKIATRDKIARRDDLSAEGVSKTITWLVDNRNMTRTRIRELATEAWNDTQQAANRHYQPHCFTTFIAYEWGAMPDFNNIHRNIIFADDHVPVSPVSILDTQDPETLWGRLEDFREQHKLSVLAIGHNANISNGLMFGEYSVKDPNESEGTVVNVREFDKDYAEARMRNEPLHEIIQVKGTSETHPGLTDNDELGTNFEIYEYQLTTGTILPEEDDPNFMNALRNSYIREGYKTGLLHERDFGVNPFKFGLIGSSDSHSAAPAPEEDNFPGAHGIEDNTPEKRLTEDATVGAKNREVAAAGLAAVWAEENTRPSIFAALERKETFATSGTRIKVRFFGGWQFTDESLDSNDWVKQGYDNGVPMGGDLSQNSDGKQPTFMVCAMKDANGANLDRVQMIKGWLDEAGETHEKIYDIAWSSGRKIDEATGQLEPLEETVDEATATYANDIGSVALKTVWTDPDFDASQPAFYYVRVLEIWTPRWTLYDAVALGMPHPNDVDAILQERAWTSPIWYTPKKQ